MEGLDRSSLGGSGQLLPREAGELTWTLQIQLVSLKVAVVEGEGGPRFWIAYVGLPGAGSAPTVRTSGLEEDELRTGLRQVMRQVVASEGLR